MSLKSAISIFLKVLLTIPITLLQWPLLQILNTDWKIWDLMWWSQPDPSLVAPPSILLLQKPHPCNTLFQTNARYASLCICLCWISTAIYQTMTADCLGHPSFRDKKFIQKFERGHPASEGVKWEWARENSQFSANKSPYLRNGAR